MPEFTLLAAHKLSMKQTDELKVFTSGKESKCVKCGDKLGRKAWFTLNKENGALCLKCSNLKHLVFLPSGNAAMTRRAKKHSTLSAVVLQWSKHRKRYERQGLLVEEKSIEKAENECLEDEEKREKRKVREAIKRAALDKGYIKEFAQHIRLNYPECPMGKEVEIAEHACLKYSGRVGRTASAKDFNEKMIRLAVIAHIRHTETEYDSLLTKGYNKKDCRSLIGHKVEQILERWKSKAG